MKIALSFAVYSDLYLAGTQDDGVPFHAEVFLVEASAADGRRWIHSARFAGCEVEVDDEGCPHFGDVRPRARARADRLLARILAAGGAVDLALWEEGRPVYGSDAYCGREEAFLERLEG